MKILVTGAAGFIGARTANMLMDAGHEVTGVDNLNDYYDPALKRYRLRTLVPRVGFRFEMGDVEDAVFLEKIFGSCRFDAVIHLAGRAGVRASIKEPDPYVNTNVRGTLGVLGNMVRHQVPKLVFSSTSSLYAGRPMPFREDADVTRPISPYAASKLAAEALCHVWHHLHGIDVSILRYFTVFGPAGRPDMAPFRFAECIRKGLPVPLFGDGSQTRDFTYIDDIASGTIAAMRPLGYEVINLGGGNEPISILEMIACFEEALGRRAHIDHLPPSGADMTDTSADVSKAARLLDWSPSVPPLEGLKRCAKWHLQEAGKLDDV